VFSRMLQGYLDAMGIDGAVRVLDMGCGTGLAARAIARRAAFSGTVLGIDRSPYLVTAAQRLAREEGVDGRLDFRTGDARAVEAGDATFDAVIAHTLVSHVEEPSLVVREAARVLRPGGMLAFSTEITRP
jgi:2-polyprenyl-3-methyl-5-hydroxy-6-metoxy-1,4-benzoquinol methylase